MDQKTQDFYQRLKVELENYTNWPSVYLFKFIVPTEKEKISQVEETFNRMGAVIKTTKSKTGKFTSISVDVTMDSPQAVVDKYIEVSGIEGIISL